MKLNAPIWSGLRVFCACCRFQSFTAAAQQLNVTPGAVSQQIKQLENTLGNRLFHRTTRQLSLTEDGKLLAEAVIPAVSRIENQLALLDHQQFKGAVQLMTSPSFTLQWLVPKLGDFYRRFPGIDLNIDARDKIDTLDPSSYDLALDYLRHDQAPDSARLYLEEVLIPVCAPDLLPSGQPFEDPEGLLQLTLLHDSTPWPGGTADQEWEYWLDQQDIRLQGTTSQLYFNRSDLALIAAQAAQGVAMGRKALVETLIAEGKLAIAYNKSVPSPAGYYLFLGQGNEDTHAKEANPSPGNATDIGVTAIYRWLMEQIDSC